MTARRSLAVIAATLVAVCLLVAPLRAAITLVSGATPAVRIINGTQTDATDLVGTVATGDLVGACTAQYKNASVPTVPTVTGEGGVSIPNVATVSFTSGSDHIRISVFALANVTGGANWTVSIDQGASGDVTWVPFELAGIATTSAQDGSGVSATGNSTAPSVNLTTGVVNDVILGCFAHDSTNRTLTPGSGYSMIAESEGGSAAMPIHAEYRVVTTATTYAVDGTIGTGAANWIIAAAAFKDAGGGGGPTPARRLLLLGVGGH